MKTSKKTITNTPKVFSWMYENIGISARASNNIEPKKITKLKNNVFDVLSRPLMRFENLNFSFPSNLVISPFRLSFIVAIYYIKLLQMAIFEYFQ